MKLMVLALTVPAVALSLVACGGGSGEVGSTTTSEGDALVQSLLRPGDVGPGYVDDDVPGGSPTFTPGSGKGPGCMNLLPDTYANGKASVLISSPSDRDGLWVQEAIATYPPGGAYASMAIARAKQKECDTGAGDLDDSSGLLMHAYAVDLEELGDGSVAVFGTMTPDPSRFPFSTSGSFEFQTIAIQKGNVIIGLNLYAAVPPILWPEGEVLKDIASQALANVTSYGPQATP